jgi:hypothetical protein
VITDDVIDYTIGRTWGETQGFTHAHIVPWHGNNEFVLAILVLSRFRDAISLTSARAAENQSRR